MSSQILQLRNRMIHVPSVASFRLSQTPFLRRPVLELFHYDGHYQYITYPLSILAGWDDAKRDAYKLRHAYETVNKTLSVIPMYEEPRKPSAPPAQLK